MQRRVANWLHFLAPALIYGFFGAFRGEFVGYFLVGLLFGAVWSIIRGFFKLIGFLDLRVKSR